MDVIVEGAFAEAALRTNPGDESGRFGFERKGLPVLFRLHTPVECQLQHPLNRVPRVLQESETGFQDLAVHATLSSLRGGELLHSCTRTHPIGGTARSREIAQVTEDGHSTEHRMSGVTVAVHPLDTLFLPHGQPASPVAIHV